MRHTTSPTLGSLLVVGGPSGAGKTTFIRHLKDGSLPAAILSRLPVGAAEWPVLPVGRHGAWHELAAGNGAVDIIFHVDTTRFVVDPEFVSGAHAVLQRARRIALVEVAGDRDAIVRQRLRRSWRGRRAKRRDRALTLREIKAAFRDPSCPDERLSALFERAAFEPSAAAKLLLYRGEGWQEVLDGEWRRFLAAGGIDGLPRLVVQPAGTDERTVPAWRLAADGAGSGPRLTSQFALGGSDLK